MNVALAPNPRAAISFDPATTVVTPEGVANYYWPVGQKDLEASARAIVAVYRTALSDPLRAGDGEARIAYAITSPIFMDLQSMFAARLLATRCRRDGIKPQLPSQSAPQWRAAFFGERYESRMLKILRAGVSRPPAWKRVARPLADILRPNFFSRRPIELTDMARRIVTVAPSDLMRMRARQHGVCPVYVPLYEWFYPPTPNELLISPLRPVAPVLRDKMVDALESAFESLGAQRSNMPSDAIAGMIDDMTAWVRFYLSRIARNHRRIPRCLWIGSSGVIWSRILAEAVHSAGGEVTGHDHAYGANYSENTLIPFNELQVKDVFVTFGKAHADLYRRVAPNLMIGPERPHIEHVESGNAEQAAESNPPIHAPRTVLYVPNYLSNGDVGAMPQMAPITAYDWQARLITRLQALGLTVTQKPHPQSPVPQPSIFESRFGVAIARERFEEIMHRFDVLLFDFAPQTCFGFALRSRKPIVLIDFGISTFKPELKALLERRCAVVPGWYDDDNRAQVDPDALVSAIGRASSLQDQSFAEAIVSL